MDFEIAFGKGTKTVSINDANLLGILKPNHVEIEQTGKDEIIKAIQNPIGTPRIKHWFKKGEKVCIITSDITRPMPTKKVLPYLLFELLKARVDFKDITIVFALGSHRRHTEEEMRYLVGDECFEQVRCIDADPHDCVHLGTTKMGTPVDIFRPVAEADRRICLGNIEYHYFAGYSGGAKAIMPGVSTREAIQANHSHMIEQEACAGKLEGNPIREDIESITEFIPIDFIVNVVLDEKKRIIKAVAGHYIEAHRVGCAFLDKLYKIEIERKADIVLVSPGGYPKDINLYQAQKALDNAKHAVRNGGVVILAASCKEGLGEGVFERWMTTSEKPEQMIGQIQRNFELGGHKAAAIAMVLQNAGIYLVSDLPADFVKGIFMQPFDNIQEAYDAALKKMGADAKTILMPHGGSTLPVVRN